MNLISFSVKLLSSMNFLFVCCFSLIKNLCLKWLCLTVMKFSYFVIKLYAKHLIYQLKLALKQHVSSLICTAFCAGKEKQLECILFVWCREALLRWVLWICIKKNSTVGISVFRARRLQLRWTLLCIMYSKWSSSSCNNLDFEESNNLLHARAS